MKWVIEFEYWIPFTVDSKERRKASFQVFNRRWFKRTVLFPLGVIGVLQEGQNKDNVDCFFPWVWLQCAIRGRRCDPVKEPTPILAEHSERNLYCPKGQESVFWVYVHQIKQNNDWLHEICHYCCAKLNGLWWSGSHSEVLEGTTHSVSPVTRWTVSIRKSVLWEVSVLLGSGG